MHHKEREITDPKILDEILREGKFVVAALCRNDEPYLVSLSYGHDVEKGALYFHCAKKGLKTDFIRDNPAACLTVIEDRGYKMGECSQGYRSVVLRGEMHVVEELEEKKHGMEVLLRHLEDDPDPVRERNLKDDKAYIGVGILRFDIHEITGKAGSSD
jgi:nitroimidazol reductase NimA-like FMN-containing flavoprotein (pyridoxamine 5'-phosphate oxidase superfamily)